MNVTNFLVSKSSDGVAWVANDDFSLIKAPGSDWVKGSPSPDDLKDNFSAITEPKESAAFFHAAKAAAESNPKLLRAANRTDQGEVESMGKELEYLLNDADVFAREMPSRKIFMVLDNSGKLGGEITDRDIADKIDFSSSPISKERALSMAGPPTAQTDQKPPLKNKPSKIEEELETMTIEDIHRLIDEVVAEKAAEKRLAPQAKEESAKEKATLKKIAELAKKINDILETKDTLSDDRITAEPFEYMLNEENVFAWDTASNKIFAVLDGSGKLGSEITDPNTAFKICVGSNQVSKEEALKKAGPPKEES